MTRIHSCWVVLFLALAVTSFAGEPPEIGSTHLLGQTPFKVVGSGTSPFEYTATGESLQVVIGDIPGTMVIVPAAGQVVKVDPTVPMLWIDGEPHQEFASNSYLKKHGKGVSYLLLEYIR